MSNAAGGRPVQDASRSPDTERDTAGTGGHTCGRAGAAQAIMTRAVTRISRPAAPVSQVALARSALTTALIPDTPVR
jgi:hypothetical protein